MIAEIRDGHYDDQLVELGLVAVAEDGQPELEATADSAAAVVTAGTAVAGGEGIPSTRSFSSTSTPRRSRST